MGVDMKVKAIYDSEIGNITRSEKNWKDVLKVAGQLYRYEFDNIVMVTAQRPPEKSTLMADYDTWKKVGRYVKRGAKGCAIFPSRALNPRMRYIFDISDTGGKNVKLTWDLEGENLKDYVDFLVSEGQIEQYDNSDRESLKNILKQFTGTDVWLIIKEEFGDRMTELMQLSGSVIKEESKKRNGLQQEMDMEQLVYASVMFAVGTRCGFDLSVQEQDFSQIVNIKDEEIIYRLGSIVCDVSCSVLREFSRNLKAIESERRIGYVRRNDLQGSGRTALSADRDAGRDGGSHEAGQIRKDGDELSKGERAGKIQDADEIREDVREDVSGRGGSESAVRPARDAVSGEAQATGSVIDNGDVEDKRAGEDAGRGSGTESDSDAIPLESDDTELNRELDEINSLGVSKEAEYTQASFFFDQNGQASIGTIHTEDENNNQFMRQFEQDRKAALAGKYNYLNPKKSATVPSEYIKQVLMRGTGFIGGKGRVCKIFETEIDAGTRAKRIKAEYGQGGAGWPVDGLGLHGYDTFHGNGLRFQWRDEYGEVEGYVSWKDIEKELGVLILTGEYQPETPRIDELAMDGLREDDEVIDAEYQEVEPEEAESEIDDYAIPDEPESYASNRDYVSSIEQREGRGIRQGNENEEVAIYRYVTKGTFDAYNWSLVENKQRFISQVMTSKAVSRSCEDIDEATLSYAEIKAVATGNPLIREKMEIDNDVQRLKLLKASYDNQRYGLQDNFMIKYPKLIKTATEKLANVREDVKARDKELIDNSEFAITIGKVTYTERVDGGTMMLEAISKCKTRETTAIGKFHGFELLVEKNFLDINYMVLRGKTEYKAELSTSPVGSMVKLENLFNGLHENIDFLEKKIEQYQNDLEASKAEYDKPFVYSKELEEKLSRQCELNAQLDLENAKAVDADLSGPEEERKADDRMESAAIVAEDKGAYPADREGRTR